MSAKLVAVGLIVLISWMAAPTIAAPADGKTRVTIEDNMGFVGTAWVFEFTSDGTWRHRTYFPRNKKGEKTGKLNKADTKAFLAKLEKAGAFNTKAKDVEPYNPQVADGAYFAVISREKVKGKRGRLHFKHGGPTSKAVKGIIDQLIGGAAEKE